LRERPGEGLEKTEAIFRSILTALVAVVALSVASAAESPRLSADEAFEIGVEAYVYAYPLVLMDTTRRALTNVEAVDHTVNRAPMNQFMHVPKFPDATFTEVVRPNADTLYSSLWYDVTAEP